MTFPDSATRPRPAHALRLAAASAICAYTVLAQAQVAGPVFTITRYAVEGNSLLPAAQVDSLLAPYSGPSRSFSDVRRAAEALQDAYRRRGYNLVLVQLPEQELNQGVVRLRIVEPRIGRVQVQGNRAFSTSNIRASLPGLVEGTAPNMRDISASLKVANTNPAKQTTLELRSAAAPDVVDATVRIAEDKPWRVGLNADNTGTPATGRTRVAFLYQNANLWDLDHVASVQYTTSAEHPSKVSAYGAGYHVPLYRLGDSLDFFASYSNVDSGRITAGVLDLQVSGKGSTAGARYNHVLPAWGDLTSTLIVGIDWRAYKNDMSLSGVPLGSEITVRPLSLGYSGQLALASGLLSLQLTGVQNLAGGSNGDAADFDRQRSGAQPRYRLLRYGAGYTRALPADWQLRLQLNGQATHDTLVPGEQFGAGGATSVRGFLEREVTGDRGHFASAELQSHNWCDGVLQCRALAFVDAATVTRNTVLPGEERRTSIASTGIGLRLAFDRNAALQMDYGRVVNGGGSRAAGDSRVHVALSLSY